MTKEKILLFNPPFYRFINLEQDYIPLSLLAVGAKIKDQGKKVFIKNCEISTTSDYKGYKERFRDYDIFLNNVNNNDHPVWQEVDSTIKTIMPDKIGITVLNVKYLSSIKIIDIASKNKIPVFVGGPHPTISPDSYPSNVKIFRREFESYPSNRIKNLDDTPFFDYDMLLDKYSNDGYAHLISSRGCPFECRFCASSILWDRIVTYKSVDRILKEMSYIYDRYKPEYFTFWDEAFSINKKRLFEFCNKYDLSSKWRCDTRADAINKETIKVMKSSGCHQISIGVESGNNKILEYINKRETIDIYKKAADILNENNIQWKAYVIIGFPEETEYDILQTIRFVKSLHPFRITLSFFTPYIGTELFIECLNKKLIHENYNYALYSHQSPYNYFCPKVTKKRFFELRNQISAEVDEYNKIALKIWR